MPLLKAGTVNEHSSQSISFTLQDAAGVAIPLADITTATLTFYDKDTYVPGQSPAEGILNSRNAQDIKDTNQVSIHATSGLVTWAMQGGTDGDNVICTPRRQIERHIAEFVFVVGTTELNQDVEVLVRNLGKTT